MRKSRNRGKQSDTRSTATIADAGWTIIRRREDGNVRYVARKQKTEREDETVTKKYESSYTLEGLAKNVERREREERR